MSDTSENNNEENDMFNVEELKHMINNFKEQIHKRYDEIKGLKNCIKNFEYTLYRSCNHKWIKDQNANFDDHIKFVCSECNLYRCDSLYQRPTWMVNYNDIDNI